jgi:hypothetical protein
MLAGIEKALQAGPVNKAEEEMTAIDTLLAGLFDYAGLYPPASLGMRSAANHFIEYGRGGHAWALGRFIVDLDRVDELRSIAGGSFNEFRPSVIATESAVWDNLASQIHNGNRIDALEIKCSRAEDVERIAAHIPRQLVTYFEVSMDADGQAALKPIAALGARAKIRMGGVVAEAFPSIPDIVQMLKALADLRLAFKATAGLHHPLRSRRPLTYQPQGPTGIMHGFVNLCCAAALLYFGGNTADAAGLLDEQDSSAWRITQDAIQWHDRSWTVGQLAEVRNQFLISIGSCSFEEPIHDLESLGWL